MTFGHTHNRNMLNETTLNPLHSQLIFKESVTIGYNALNTGVHGKIPAFYVFDRFVRKYSKIPDFKGIRYLLKQQLRIQCFHIV